MMATTTQLLSSGEFCKLRYYTIPVKSESANDSFYTKNSKMPILSCDTGGHAVAQLVEVLHYKTEGRGFDSRWCQWNFSLP